MAKELLFPLTPKELNFFLNTADFGRGPVMREITDMDDNEITNLKQRLRTMMRDVLKVQPQV